MNLELYLVVDSLKFVGQVFGITPLQPHYQRCHVVLFTKNKVSDNPEAKFGVLQTIELPLGQVDIFTLIDFKAALVTTISRQEYRFEMFSAE